MCVCVCRFCRLSHDGARPASVRDGDGPGLRSCSMDRAVSLTRGSTLYLNLDSILRCFDVDGRYRPLHRVKFHARYGITVATCVREA